MRQGEASRGAFLIRSGAVEARVALPGGGTLTVAEFRDGDMFGEMALIERGVCSASVVAHSNVDAWFGGRDADISLRRSGQEKSGATGDLRVRMRAQMLALLIVSQATIIAGCCARTCPATSASC